MLTLFIFDSDSRTVLELDSLEELRLPDITEAIERTIETVCDINPPGSGKGKVVLIGRKD